MIKLMDKHDQTWYCQYNRFTLKSQRCAALESMAAAAYNGKRNGAGSAAAQMLLWKMERMEYMKIVVLDGYTLFPGDLDMQPLCALGEVAFYDRTPQDDAIL